MNNLKETITVGELRRWLAPVSLARRKAIIFSLETGIPPNEVSKLSWKQAFALDLSPTAIELVRSMPRHLKLPYVFWEYLQMGIAAPLFSLEDTVLEACCGRPWPAMKLAYDGMAWVDTFAEAEDFKRAFEEIGKSFE